MFKDLKDKIKVKEEKARRHVESVKKLKALPPRSANDPKMKG